MTGFATMLDKAVGPIATRAGAARLPLAGAEPVAETGSVGGFLAVLTSLDAPLQSTLDASPQLTADGLPTLQDSVPVAGHPDYASLALFFRQSGSLAFGKSRPEPMAGGLSSKVAPEISEAGVSDETEDVPFAQMSVASDLSWLPQDPLQNGQALMGQPLLTQLPSALQPTAQPVVSDAGSDQAPKSAGLERTDIISDDTPAPVARQELSVGPLAVPGVEGTLTAVSMPNPPATLFGLVASSPLVQSGQPGLATAPTIARADTSASRPNWQSPPPALAPVASLDSTQDPMPPAGEFLASETPGEPSASPERALAASMKALTPPSQGVARQIVPPSDFATGKDAAPREQFQFAKLSSDETFRPTEGDSRVVSRASRRPAVDEPPGRPLTATFRAPETAALKDAPPVLVSVEAVRQSRAEEAPPRVETSSGSRLVDPPWVQATGSADLRVELSANSAGVVSDTPETALANTVTYWATQGIQNAELKLDAWGGEALEVSISMNGNQADIEFRTDQPEIRQVIESAMPQLKDMLAQDGLILSGVAVGGSGGQASDSPARRPPPGSRQARVNQSPDPLEPARSLSASTGIGRALDLFV